MSKFIPLSVPCIKGNEWIYIKECLDTEWVSSAGKYVDRFEKDICKFTGAKYAVACVNGTSALHIALKLVGLQSGDEVIVPTLTFIAPVNVVKYHNADPIFMDCDKYYNLDIDKTTEFIDKETSFKNGATFNKSSGKKISAIIPVHVFGNGVDLERLFLKCMERNIKIVEDATESLGTFFSNGLLKGKHTGTIGDIGCLSFNGNKIITTGGGGMIVTNNPKYAEKAKYLTTQAKDDEIRYIHNEIGYNFRLSNVQAALGVAQLEKLPEYLKIKKQNYKIYKKYIDNIPGLCLAEVPNYAKNNYWMYCLQIEKDIYKKDREKLLVYLREHQIQTRPVWFLNHLQKPYRFCQTYNIEKAIKMYEQTLNIPCSVGLKKNEIETIVNLLKNE